MNNEQKKDYAKPEITIVEMVHDTNLLQDSIVETCWGGGEGDENCNEESGDDDDSEGQSVMKKEYCTPEINVFCVDTKVVLLGASETHLPSGPTAMIQDDPATSLPKNVGQ